MVVLRWLFVIAPARAYKRGEASSGAVPWLYLFPLIGLGVLGGLVGAGLGYLLGDPEAGVGAGVVTGCLLMAAWFIYVLMLVGFMRLRGRPLETLLGPGWLRRQQRWYDR